jgi:hypothetical protein
VTPLQRYGAAILRTLLWFDPFREVAGAVGDEVRSRRRDKASAEDSSRLLPQAVAGDVFRRGGRLRIGRSRRRGR